VDYKDCNQDLAYDRFSYLYHRVAETHNDTRQDNPHFDKVEVFFNCLHENLSEKIREHRDGLIFGAVAWLTSKPILEALIECDSVQMLVQKEEYLRNDNLDTFQDMWKEPIKRMYSDLSFNNSYVLNSPLSDLYLDKVDPVRCVGYYSKGTNFPRMHNKFMVFCKSNVKYLTYGCGCKDRLPCKDSVYNELSDSSHRMLCPLCIGQNESIVDNDYIQELCGAWCRRISDACIEDYSPVAVWTGSFNFSHNGSISLENAIYLEDMSGDNPILKAYLTEHHHLFCVSESLKWESTGMDPEYTL